MALDPYGPCPCGSGKKFKWCCQDIRAEIDRALQQDEAGQHEAALRTMQEVVQAHPDNPEAFGRQAELLYRLSRQEEAEAALDKAFALNPNYPFGLLLRAQFRYLEGELVGALMLLRKAEEHYAPDAIGPLAAVYQLLFECESKRNNPVASRAALQRLLQLQPTDTELRQAFDNLFGDQSRLPAAARRDYRFLPASPERGRAWEERLHQAATGKLTDGRQAFLELTQQEPQEPAAWFNLALAQAWLGENRAALEALDHYFPLETDAGRATTAAALAEVLRCGMGVEDLADYRSHLITYRLQEPQAIVRVLQELERQGRLFVDGMDQERGILSGRVLEAPTLTVTTPGVRLASLAASLLLVQDALQLRHTNRERLEKVAAEFQQILGTALTQRHEAETFVHFGEVVLEALAFPIGNAEAAEFEPKLRDHVAGWFEEVWLHRPLKSLGGVPPIDAAGHPILRNKLLGTIQFLHDCLQASAPRLTEGEGQATAIMDLYDFDRLRHKLGLSGSGGSGSSGDLRPPLGETAVGPDIKSMSAADLAALAIEKLSDEQLEESFRAALKLDARDLAGKFATALVARPANPERPDRYPFFQHLTQLRLDEGDQARAQQLLDQAIAADLAQNEGRRRNDYELRKAQLLAKNGQAEAAATQFEQLIQRADQEPKYLGSAAEAMLSAKQGGRALQFAEQGLAQARARNSRDLEEYFQELVAAAKKQGG